MKKILANTIYSDTTLKSWKKEDLIEHIRVLEHNWQSTLTSLNNSAKTCKKLYEENESLKRLMSLIDNLSTEELIEIDKAVEKIKAQMLEKNTREVLDIIYDYGQDYFFEELNMEEDDFNQMLNLLAKQFKNKE